MTTASSQSLARGEAYYREGAVRAKARRGNILTAEVEGSQYEPYVARAMLDAGGVAAWTCSCPYGFGGACKHVVAMLLAYVDFPEAFVERPDAADLVAGLGADVVRRIIAAAAEEVKGFDTWLEAWLAVPDSAAAASEIGTPAKRSGAAGPTESAAAGSRHRTLVDTRPIAREVKQALQSANPHDWRHGVDAPTVLEPTVERARTFLQNGDGANALAILEVIYTETVPGYDWLEGECELADCLRYSLAPLAAEAILLANLDAQRRAQLREAFQEWRAQLSDYGLEEAFDLPLQALARGWVGEPGGDGGEGENRGADGDRDEDDRGGGSGDSSRHLISLDDIQLDALEHSGRVDDFLARAAALGQWRRRALKLIELQRLDEAIADAEHLATATDALLVAQALREAGRLEPAVALAARGLDWPDPTGTLGRWLGPIAARLGRPDLARRAWQAAYDARPDVDAYRALELLAPADTWPELRQRLLTKAEAANTFGHAGAAILLAAGELDRAIQVADARSHDEHLAALVADAAITARPAWVIRTGSRLAEGQIGKVKSSAYAHAVVWLKRVKQAHAAAGMPGEWDAYLRELKARHSRKRALLDMLEDL